MLTVGTIFQGKYRVKRQLGAGSFGAVYLVSHERVPESELALKVIRPPPAAAMDYRRRFLQEVRIGCRLRNPHAIPVRDFDATEDGLLYFTMDRVPGTPLDAVIARTGAMPWRRAVEIARQLLEALDEAHREGVIHRDVKPGNVLLEERTDGTDFVRVLDFGIARMMGTDAVTLEWMGTPHYMAPEQAQTPQKIDGRADVYATGILLYELLTGSRPFRAPDPLEILLMHRSTAPFPPTEARPDLAIPPAVEAIVLQALEKRPEDRYSSAATMIDAIDAVVAVISRQAHAAHGDGSTGSASGSPDAITLRPSHGRAAPARGGPSGPLGTGAGGGGAAEPETATRIPTRTMPPVAPGPSAAAASPAPHRPSAALPAAAAPGAAAAPRVAVAPRVAAPAAAPPPAPPAPPPPAVTAAPARAARLVIGGRIDHIFASPRLRIGRAGMRAPSVPEPGSTPDDRVAPAVFVPCEVDIASLSPSGGASDLDWSEGTGPIAAAKGTSLRLCELLLYGGSVCLRDMSSHGTFVDGERAVRGTLTYLASRFLLELPGTGLALVGRIFPRAPGDDAPGAVRLEPTGGTAGGACWVWLMDEAAIGPDDGPLPLFDDEELGAALRADDGAICYRASDTDEKWVTLLEGDAVRIGGALLSGVK